MSEVSLCSFSSFFPTTTTPDKNNNLSTQEIFQIDNTLKTFESLSTPICSLTMPVRRGIPKEVLPMLNYGSVKEPVGGQTLSYRDFVYQYVGAIAYTRHLTMKQGSSWQNILGAASDKPLYPNFTQLGFSKVIYLDVSLELGGQQVVVPANAMFATLMEETTHMYTIAMVKDGKLDGIHLEPLIDEYNAKTVKLAALESINKNGSPKEKAGIDKAIAIAQKELGSLKQQILKKYVGRVGNIIGFAQAKDHSYFVFKDLKILGFPG